MVAGPEDLLWAASRARDPSGWPQLGLREQEADFSERADPTTSLPWPTVTVRRWVHDDLTPKARTRRLRVQRQSRISSPGTKTDQQWTWTLWLDSHDLTRESHPVNRLKIAASALRASSKKESKRVERSACHILQAMEESFEPRHSSERHSWTSVPRAERWLTQG